LLAFFRARAIAGIEFASEDRYVRTFEEAGEVGCVEVSHDARAQSLIVNVRTGRVQALSPIVNRVRRAFDLASDVTLICTHLASDPLLAPLVAARPGLRVPGGWNGFELAARAVLGQQVSVAAARLLGERLVRLCGTPVLLGPALTRLFPNPEQVAGADLSRLGTPRSRADALSALAQAALADPRLFEPGPGIEDTVAKLRRVRGIGAWTAHYIALRAARDPDAFPASDRGILRGMAACRGEASSAAALESHAERWRPWRAYAAQHLWAADAAVSSALPPSQEVARGSFK
jgi:AraC family transcriptional regulator of adaptative response / DNA-3-methyladenine glycosylase II